MMIPTTLYALVNCWRNPPKKSESGKPLVKVVVDDDDCMVLDGDPDKSIVVVNNKVDGDGSDDLEIVGEKGEVWFFYFILFSKFVYFMTFICFCQLLSEMICVSFN